MRQHVLPALAPGTVMRAVDAAGGEYDRVVTRRFSAHGVTYEMVCCSPDDMFGWEWYRRFQSGMWRVATSPAG